VAFAAAALTIAGPADYGFFYLATLATHLAFFSYLTAVWAWIAWWQSGRPGFLLLAWAAMAFSTGTYEAVYPLALFTPLLLLALERETAKRTLAGVLAWYAVPLLAGARLLLILRSQQAGTGYQAGLFRSYGPGALLSNLGLAYRRQFLDGWLANRIPVSAAHVVYGVVAALLVSATCWWLLRREPFDRPVRFPLVLAAAGFAIVGLGFAPFLATIDAHSDFRTFFYSWIGAALALTALAWLLSVSLWRRPWLLPLLAGLLAGTGTTHLVDQHALWARRWNDQRAILSEVMQRVPRADPRAAIVILDATGDRRLKTVFGHNSLNLNSAVKLLLDDGFVRAALCYPAETAPWGTAAETCTLGQEGLVLRRSQGSGLSRPGDALIVFSHGEDGRLTLETSLPGVGGYAPEKLIRQGQRPTSRACRMLELPGCR
jgi:hypothetical protein